MKKKTDRSAMNIRGVPTVLLDYFKSHCALHGITLRAGVMAAMRRAMDEVALKKYTRQGD